MTVPRVTVSIPTYNRSGTVRQAVESVLEQSLKDIEVVVLDNASTDDTADVVASFEDPRVRYVRNETNIGVMPNISKGFRAGEARFVTVLPDDDLMRPDNLERKLHILDRRPEVDVVFSANDFVHLGPDGHSQTETHYGGGREDGIDTGETVLRRLLTSIPPYWINYPTAMIRRSIIDEEARMDPADGRADDLGFALRLVRRANLVAYIAEPLVTSRVHPEAANVKMGVNEYDSGVYKPTLVSLDDRNHVKRRFLGQNSQMLEDLGDIQAGIRRASRIESLWIARRKARGATFGERWKVVREAVRREPSLLPSRELALMVTELMPGSSGHLLRRATNRLTRPIVRRRDRQPRANSISNR